MGKTKIEQPGRRSGWQRLKAIVSHLLLRPSRVVEVPTTAYFRAVRQGQTHSDPKLQQQLRRNYKRFRQRIQEQQRVERIRAQSDKVVDLRKQKHG